MLPKLQIFNKDLSDNFHIKHGMYDSFKILYKDDTIRKEFEFSPDIFAFTSGEPLTFSECIDEMLTLLIQPKHIMEKNLFFIENNQFFHFIKNENLKPHFIKYLERFKEKYVLTDYCYISASPIFNSDYIDLQSYSDLEYFEFFEGYLYYLEKIKGMRAFFDRSLEEIRPKVINIINQLSSLQCRNMVDEFDRFSPFSKIISINDFEIMKAFIDRIDDNDKYYFPWECFSGIMCDKSRAYLLNKFSLTEGYIEYFPDGKQNGIGYFVSDFINTPLDLLLEFNSKGLSIKNEAEHLHRNIHEKLINFLERGIYDTNLDFYEKLELIFKMGLSNKVFECNPLNKAVESKNMKAIEILIKAGFSKDDKGEKDKYTPNETIQNIIKENQVYFDINNMFGNENTTIKNS